MTGDRGRIWLAILWVFVLAFVVRLPYFFRIAVDWDEATYVLVGQSLLDGHLPYTETWEIKPPLGFVAYALIIGVLGKSIVSIRVGGAICVALTGIAVLLTGRAAWSLRAGMLAAMLFVLLASLVPAGQALMTEHVALVPLGAALAFAATRAPTTRNALGLGVLLGLASMVRLNLAYMAILVGIWLALAPPPESIAGRARRVGAYAAGGLAVVLAGFLPYALGGKAGLWWSAVVLAPLGYLETENGWAENLVQHASRLWSSDLPGLLRVGTLVWPLGASGAVVAGLRGRRLEPDRRWALATVAAFFVAAALSVLKSGASREHYLLQVFPPMAVFAGVALDAALATRARAVAGALVGLSFAISFQPVVRQYVAMAERLSEGRPLVDGPTWRVAEYLRRRGAAGAPLYLMVDHVVYWLLDTAPISRITHPSNVGREELLPFILGPEATSESAMAEILARKPRYVVTREKLWYLDRHPETRALLEAELRENYVLVRGYADRQIYRRRPRSAPRRTE